MALTGLEIYKLLPKTNCKECGFPTCLAFAMKLAQKGTELDKCPYVTDETRAALDAASAPVDGRVAAEGAGQAGALRLEQDGDDERDADDDLAEGQERVHGSTTSIAVTATDAITG